MKDMQPLIFVALALVIAIVAIDALVRDPRAPRRSMRVKDQRLVSTEKIVIDLSKRR
jgi:hypothetical protein